MCSEKETGAEETARASQSCASADAKGKEEEN